MFFLAPISEGQESVVDNSIEVVNKVVQDQTEAHQGHKDDCHSGDHTDCCSNHCKCLSNFIFNFDSETLKSPIISKNHNNWFYYTNYTSPTLDPALKPPFLS
jgi:hypothetical protein